MLVELFDGRPNKKIQGKGESGAVYLNAFKNIFVFMS